MTTPLAFASSRFAFLLAASLGFASLPFAVASGPNAVNLALVARSSTSFVSGHETLAAVNDGFTPENSDDKRHGAYGNWPRNGTQWVQYDWSQPIRTDRIEVYWFDDHRGVRLPKACRLQYWDGTAFVPVPKADGPALQEHRFNAATFPEVTTTRLRLEFDSEGTSSTGILEWRVLDSGQSPNFPPVVQAGPDRTVVLPGATYLAGAVRDDGKPSAPPRLQWRRASGPGRVTFSDPASLTPSARFSAAGTYTLELTADDGAAQAAAKVRVEAVPAPPKGHLVPVWTTAWQDTSPFWQPRLKGIVCRWIPHCVRKIEDPALAEGGLENFVQAANKLAGRPAKHVGAPFANTWVYNTVEAICLALMLDPQGDTELATAQAGLRATLDQWIPKLLGAQEPDGYLHTQYTIQGHPRWSNKDDHEGYQAGYFIEAALAHYRLTGGQDRRLFDAALRLADCWVKNIGPAPKRAWHDGHQELEQALVKLARFLEQYEPSIPGRPYVQLAKFLLDDRWNGDAYDQTHLPVTRQYEAVGHAVRALYSYTGMADVAMETGDPDYHSAVRSLWDNIVNRKYYVTGGVGSGETSEGFGRDYSLPNRAYCETCAGSGELFFQQRMQQIYREARYADLAEETLFNAILGGLDLAGENFTYTNPLDSGEKRYGWHVCPCCVGNLARTLLSLPTWCYTRDATTICVNLYAGGQVNVGAFGGTPVKVEQVTDYPWRGGVQLALHPARPARFTLKVRVPDRQSSALYRVTPATGPIAGLTLNGRPVAAKTERGYLTLTRTWREGDRLAFELPLPVQRIHAAPELPSLAGRVALRRGPLLYNLESVDQDLESVLAPDAPLSAEWQADLLGGVTVIRGTLADGKPLQAVPNYARLNRGGRSIVWLKER